MAEILFWLLMAWALASRGPVIVYLFFGAIAFGAMSVLPAEATGGTNVLPKAICGVMLFAKAFLKPGGPAATWEIATNPRKAGLLVGFFGVAVVTTVFMPFVFHGRAVVVGLNTAQLGLLAPISANVTQLAYLGFSIMTVLGVCLWHQMEGGRALLLRGALFGAAVMVVTGLADVATHGSDVLGPFRNASYAILAGEEILGSSRIIGLMPEASAYGGMCVAFLSVLYFAGRGFGLDGRYPWRFWCIVAGVFTMAALSTSSTAYLGLGAFAGMAGLDWLLRLVADRELAARRRLFAEFAVMTLVVVGFLLLAVFHPSSFDPVVNMLDRMVLRKTESSSFAERSMWNRIGLDTLGATYGLGVGVGSTRVSSWPVAIVSSTGILGAALMLGFILVLLLRGVDSADARFARGARMALLVCLVPGAFAGTLVDFNPIVALLFGLLCVVVPRPVRVADGAPAAFGHTRLRAVRASR